MTRERTIEQLKLMLRCPEDNLDDEDREAVEVCIKALSAGTCDDCVSRTKVEEITWDVPIYTDAFNVLVEVRDRVRALPSASPQQRTGRWIDDEFGIKCSCCGIYILI